MSAVFLKHSQNKKNASSQGSKFETVFNSFWKGTRREKTCLKKVSE